LGFSLAFSGIAVGIIHGGFAYPTQKSWIPILGNPLFNVYVDTLNKAKHGSDSETYDTEVIRLKFVKVHVEKNTKK
jgi:peroxygenase